MGAVYHAWDAELGVAVALKVIRGDITGDRDQAAHVERQFKRELLLARFAEGLPELEACQKRRGEATALFFDDKPTVRYLAPVSYWAARAEEGLKMASARSRYQAFIDLRKDAVADPLVQDARRRLQ